MTVNEIIRTIDENKGKFMVYGIRGDDRIFSVKDELPCSQNMVDDLYDHETGDYPLLDGTCAIGFGYLWFDGEDEDIKTVEKAIAMCAEYGFKNMYLIAGYDYNYGDDDSEIVIKCAEVVGII